MLIASKKALLNSVIANDLEWLKTSTANTA